MSVSNGAESGPFDIAEGSPYPEHPNRNFQEAQDKRLGCGALEIEAVDRGLGR